MSENWWEGHAVSGGQTQADGNWWEAHPADGAEPAKPAGGLAAAAKQAIGAGIKGAGQLGADFLPGVGRDNAVSAYGQEVIDANPTAINSFSDMAESPWTTAKEAVGNAGGSMASMLGARALGMGMTAAAPLTGPAAPFVAGAGQLIANAGPIVAAALPSYGGIRESQIAADPANEADGKSKAIAMLGAGAVGAIESAFGPQAWAQAAMKKGGIEAIAKHLADAKSIPGAIGKGILRGGAIEGAEELVQNPIEQVAGYQDPTTRQAIGETLFGGAMGAVGGGVIGGGMGGFAKAMEQQPTDVQQPPATPAQPAAATPPGAVTPPAQAAAPQTPPAAVVPPAAATPAVDPVNNPAAVLADPNAGVLSRVAATGELTGANEQQRQEQAIAQSAADAATAQAAAKEEQKRAAEAKKAAKAGNVTGLAGAGRQTTGATNEGEQAGSVTAGEGQNVVAAAQGIGGAGATTQAVGQVGGMSGAAADVRADAAGMDRIPAEPIADAAVAPPQDQAVTLPLEQAATTTQPGQPNGNQAEITLPPAQGRPAQPVAPADQVTQAIAAPPDARPAPASVPSLEGRTDQQLAYLSTNGQPGYREAATAEIERRAAMSPKSVSGTSGNPAGMSAENVGDTLAAPAAKPPALQYPDQPTTGGGALDQASVPMSLGEYGRRAASQPAAVANSSELPNGSAVVEAKQTKKRGKQAPSHHRVRLRTPFGDFDVFVEHNKDADRSDYINDAKNALGANYNLQGFSGKGQMSVMEGPDPTNGTPDGATSAKNASWAKIAKAEKAAPAPVVANETPPGETQAPLSSADAPQTPSDERKAALAKKKAELLAARAKLPTTAPNMRRDDLVGAIMRVTGGNGIAAKMALTVAGDTANRLTKLRGLFTGRGTEDLGDVAMLLREEEAFDVRNGEHLSELIRAASAGDVAVSSARSERDADADKEKQWRDRIRAQAKKYGVKSVAVKFSDLESRVLAIIDQHHKKAVAALDTRAQERFNAALAESQKLVPDEELDAVLTALHDKGMTPLEFWRQATAAMRAMNQEAIAKQRNEAEDEFTSQEPDWFSDDDGQGNQPASGGGAGTGVDQSPESEGLELTGQTPAELAEAEAERVAAEKAKKAASDKAAADEKAAADRKAIKQASERAADTFVLGGNALDNLTGQQGIFDEAARASSPDIGAMFDDIMGEIAPQEAAPETSATQRQPRAPRAPSAAPRPPRDNPAPRGAGEAAASAAKNLAGGFGDITNALGALFGTKSGGRLSTGISFDEETYAKALPLFKAAATKFKAAAQDLRDVMKALMLDVQSKFGNDTLRNMKPYVVRFMGDVQAGKIKIGERNVTDERSGTNLERDSENAATPDGVGEKGVLAEPGSDGGIGGSGVQDPEASGRAGSSDGVSGHEALAAGAARDLELHTGATELSPGSAGNSVSVGSGDVRLDGPPIEPDAAKGIDAAATSRIDLAKRLALQARAPRSPDASIKDALPMLSEGQKEDVEKAEIRFAKPDGYGMLFTNGTGTGKTFTGLGVVKRFANAGKSDILIVVPSDKIIEDWQNSGKMLDLDITALANTKDAGKGIVVTTYANMGANEALVGRKWDLVVHDEAHHLMENGKTAATESLKALRALTMHPDGALDRYSALNAADIAKLADLDALAKSQRMSDDERSWALAGPTQDKAEKLRGELRLKLDAIRAEVAASQGANRPRALFLSFTPFAYEPSIDWANGYLFDYDEGRASDNDSFRGYNQGSNRDQFFMQHFEYRMRAGKLNKPDARVDSDLMQRNFNKMLRQKGSLSGRSLDVDADYDRKFILVDSAIGQRIDTALQWFDDQERNTKDKTRTAALRDVHKIVSDKFDYLSRRYLLEAIKAREVVPHIREHLAMGRKVVAFHDYNQGGGFNPFDLKMRVSGADFSESGDTNLINSIIGEFKAEFKDLIGSPLFESSSPITYFQQEFPDVLLVNGSVSKQKRRENIAKFQDDASGPQVILVQANAGKEGISLHDTTGKHQRVLFNLGQPTQPTMAMQQEGRIYRMGQVTDAIIRYLNTGTNWEKWAFATIVANRSSTAENLGSGEQARAIKDAFIEGFMESGDYRAGMEGEGKGGKARDKAANNALTEYDRAKSFYFGTQKKDSRTKAQEGVDYFATPEPIGLKMAEFADIRPGDDVLEPSAGHGAIARWFNDKAKRTAIEPSMALRARLALVFDGSIVGSDFESMNVVNKFDAIVMNPPFGMGGKTAVDHLAKAATHLRDGGRIVALLPSGPAADKRLDKWLNGGEEVAVKPLVTHPTLGPIYKGDTIKVAGFSGAYPSQEMVVGGIHVSPGASYAIPKGEKDLRNSVNLVAVKSVEGTGSRTEKAGPAKGFYLIADMQLPTVTFERAGIGVRTHIIVLEKQTDKDNLGSVPQQINRDYSDAADIGELFERMESAYVKPRENARKDDAPAQKEKPAEAPGMVQPEGEKATVEKMMPGRKLLTDAPVVTHTTKDGKTIEGVITSNLSRADAKSIDPYTWPTRGGFFIRIRHIKRPPAVSEETRYNVATDTSATPADKAIYGMVAEGKTAAEILGFISKASRRPFNRYLANALRNMGGLPSIELGSQSAWRISGASPAPRYAAAYNPKTNAVALFTARDAERHALHELVHFATLKAIAAGGPASVQMRGLFLYLKRNGSLAGQYGMSNLDEFVAEAFSNPKFQAALKAVPAPKGSTLKNAWKWFVRAVRTALGMHTPAMETALDRAMTDGAKLMRENAALTGEAGGVRNSQGEAPYHRFTNAAADTGAGYMMFGEDPEKVRHYGKNHYVFDQTSLPESSVVYAGSAKFKAAIINALSNHQEILDDYQATAEQFADEANPSNIVDGAGIWDSPEIVGIIRAEVMEPNGWKAVETNDGAIVFDESLAQSVDEDIRYNLATDWYDGPSGAPVRNAWQAAKAKAAEVLTPKRLDKIIYEMQDKFIDLKNLRAHIKEIGGAITDMNDAYLGEELYHKRLAHRTEQFQENELLPLLEDAKAKGVSKEELETFLHARHAPEANAAMAKRNPNQAEIDAGRLRAKAMVRGLELRLQRAEATGSSTAALSKALNTARGELMGWNSAQAFRGTEDERTSLSGMSDADADALMNGLAPARLADLDSLAAKVDAINAGTLDLLDGYGLMSKDALTEWRKEYQHYVPLHRDEAHPDSLSHPIGQGFSTKGDAAKRRTGSNQKVTNILGHIAMQREAALTRGEKNRVMLKLYLMARQNPLPEVWKVGSVEMLDTIDKATGFVRSIPDPLHKNRPNVLVLRVAGKDVAITFNEHNPEALRMAHALKNLDVDDLHYLIPVVGKVTRWFASINTQYNPIFGVVNLLRDTQEAALNLSMTELAGKQGEILKDQMSILKEVLKNKGRMPRTGPWAALFAEFNEIGGSTGYRDLFLDAADRSKALQDTIDKLDQGKAGKAWDMVKDWLSDYNEAMENSTRLAAYKAALDTGMSKERAASLAKNLTVNFNRKGRQTRELGALYAFFNAAAQGTTRMAQTLKGPAGRKIMAGGVMLGAMNAMIGIAIMGGDDDEGDEWEKIPEFIREKSIIIPISKSDYISIPIPLGFQFLPNIGRLFVEWANYKDKTAGKQFASMFNILAGAFNPIGGSAPPMQIVAPTVLDPFVALAQNRDWTGKPIFIENRNSLDPSPGASRSKESATPWAKWFAETINSATGGTEYTPGGWSPTPDQIDYVIGQLTGGVGREVGKIASTATAPFTGEELPPHKIPLAGRFYGNTEGYSGQSEKFYANITRANEVENEIKGRVKAGESPAEYMKENPGATALAARGNAAERQVAKLRKFRREIAAKDAPGAAAKVKALNERIAGVMTRFNLEVARAQQ